MSEGAGVGIGSAQDLAAELRRLVLRAERRAGGRGALKRTALARKIGVSASSLYAYLSGVTLPSTTTLDLLLCELDVSDTQRRRLSTARDRLEADRSAQGHKTDSDAPASVPRELPPDVHGFTGRQAQSAELSRLLVPGAGSPAVVVAGTGGVGKTALAVHWGHQVRDQFPDGQLYADLRGYHWQEPVEPIDALGTLLRSLGLSDADIPQTLTDRIARYRTLLDRRRALVVLTTPSRRSRSARCCPAALPAVC